MSTFVKNYFMLFVFMIFFISLGVIVLMPHKPQDDGAAVEQGGAKRGYMAERDHTGKVASEETGTPALLDEVPESAVSFDPFPVLPMDDFDTPSLEIAVSNPSLPIASNGHSSVPDLSEDAQSPLPVVEPSTEPTVDPTAISPFLPEVEEPLAEEEWIPFVYMYEMPRHGNTAHSKVYIFPVTPVVSAVETESAQPSTPAPVPSKTPLASHSLLPVMYGPMPVTSVTPMFPVYPIYRPRISPLPPVWMPQVKTGRFGATRLVYPNGVVVRQKAFMP